MAKILIVDDEDSIRQNLRRFLTLEGHEVLEARDGSSAIEVMQENMPELVLCDLMMPNIDGYGVLEALRQYDVKAQIPFVFLTASAEKSEREKCFAQGADGYLAKPFSLSKLKTLLSTFLHAG